MLYDYSTTNDNFASDTGNTHQLAASVARYGLRELPIASKGIISASVAEKVAKSHFYRIGDGSPPIAVRAFMSQQPRDLGELVNITSDIIPDIEAGTYSITAQLAEIEARAFSPHNPEVAMTLGVTSYRRGRYRLIGASGQAVYDSQTQAVKDTNMSIADSSQQLGAANDPAHLIGA